MVRSHPSEQCTRTDRRREWIASAVATAPRSSEARWWSQPASSNDRWKSAVRLRQRSSCSLRKEARTRWMLAIPRWCTLAEDGG